MARLRIGKVDSDPGLPWRMPADDTAAIFESDLPLVRREFPLPLRMVVVAFGVVIVGLPMWELGPGLWPPNIATPVFGIIIVGATSIGIRMIGAGLSGWSDTWSYPPGAIVVKRRAWGRETTTRLTHTNVAKVEVRQWEHADHDEQWQVVVLPRPTFSGMAAFAGPGGVFNAGKFASQAYAERVRQALSRHLGV